jgi:hypothetical protein
MCITSSTTLCYIIGIFVLDLLRRLCMFIAGSTTFSHIISIFVLDPYRRWYRCITSSATLSYIFGIFVLDLWRRWCMCTTSSTTFSYIIGIFVLSRRRPSPGAVSALRWTEIGPHCDGLQSASQHRQHWQRRCWQEQIASSPRTTPRIAPRIKFNARRNARRQASVDQPAPPLPPAAVRPAPPVLPAAVLAGSNLQALLASLRGRPNAILRNQSGLRARSHGGWFFLAGSDYF